MRLMYARPYAKSSYSCLAYASGRKTIMDTEMYGSNRRCSKKSTSTSIYRPGCINSQFRKYGFTSPVKGILHGVSMSLKGRPKPRDDQVQLCPRVGKPCVVLDRNPGPEAAYVDVFVEYATELAVE